MRSREDLIRDTEPFPQSIIKTLPPRNEAYVSWNHYAQRLLFHHGGHSYRVTHVVFGDGLWTIGVELEIAGETYGAVGTDKKADAAESQAYKRACAHAGIGLHLYGDFWLHARLKDSGGEGSPESPGGVVPSSNPPPRIRTAGGYDLPEHA